MALGMGRHRRRFLGWVHSSKALCRRRKSIPGTCLTERVYLVSVLVHCGGLEL